MSIRASQQPASHRARIAPGALLVLLAAGLLAAAHGQEPAAGAYRLDAGDRIRILVFGEPDLSPELRIGERGTIPYPFLGDLSLRGLTVNEVEALITRGLKGPYLVDPRVSVTVVEYRPFYLDGEVRSPGSFSWEPGMTVRKAITLAGGLTERAGRKVYLQPAGGGERMRVELDHPVGPGDIISVEESFF